MKNEQTFHVIQPKGNCNEALFCYNLSMIILVGASASGKTEVAKILREKFHLQKVITHTTRAPRDKEVNGRDYYFVSVEEFKRLEKEGFFIETTKYNDNYYGTSKNEVGDDKVLIVEPNGLKSFQKIKDQHLVTFLFQVDEITRFRRMIERGDDAILSHKRILGDQNKFTLANVGKTDYIIDSENYSLNEVSAKIYELYQISLSRIKD